MQTINKFNQLASTPDLGQIIKTSGLNTASELNCMRIGIVDEFFPNDLTVRVQIAGKKQIGLNTDGTQRVRDFAPIYAKVCYCNPFITNEIKKGDECILLFSDREIESWFINGDINPYTHTRMHDLTDAIAIFGIRSLPNMIELLRNCLNLFYGNSNIQISDNKITINSSAIDINGTLTINGVPYLSHVHSNGNEGANTGGVVQ